MGEATSRTRPLNSLLEEDLDFDRAARVVPVVTEETTKTLEDLIKGRILEVRLLPHLYMISVADIEVVYRTGSTM